jgi:phosphate transport system permease protein
MATTPSSIRLGPIRERKPRGESLSNYRWYDRVAFVGCWAAGIMLCVVAAAIVGYMLYRGVQYLSLDLITSRPQAGVDQSKTGGFLDPIVGTLILTTVGITLAVPIAVATAIWHVEYGRPRILARAVESAIEVLAGTPDIVFAIFGLLLFQNGIFAWLSFTAQGGSVFGRSFLTAGAMMSLIALPMVFGATREGLQAVPRHVREASYGLGKTKIATIRRVLLPAVRPNIGTGAALGMGRIAGDTAVVVILLGATLQLGPEGSIPGLNVLKGTGSTLTSYVYNNSPAGEGNAPQKAYAAAFVLLLIVVLLNFVVARIVSRGSQYTYGGGR